MQTCKTDKCFLGIIFLLINSIYSFGQSDILFNHLTTQDGLSTNNVRAFIQDYQGFMWIGSENGLNRYDGYEFKPYQHIQADSSSIHGNFILSLFEDSKKRLWIGKMDGGASLYDRDSDGFYNFLPNRDDSTSVFGKTISSFYESEEGILWLTSEQGGLSYVDLNQFDPGKPSFNNISLPANLIDTGAIWVTSLMPRDQESYWVIVQGAGLLILHKSNHSFTYALPKGDYDLSHFDNRLTGILKDSKDRIWLSSWGGGIYLFNPFSKQLINYRLDPDNPASIANNHVQSMLVDQVGKFWLATDDGLCIMTDFEDEVPIGRFRTYRYDPFDEHGLGSNAVKPLYLDHQNRIWIGTYFKGISIYDPDYFKFKIVKNHPLIKSSLPDDNISTLIEDKNRNLWLGTNNSGLFKVVKGTENLYNFKFEKISLINSVTNQGELKIKCLSLDKKGNIWVGSWGGGLYRYDPLLNKSYHYKYNIPGGVPSESVLCISTDQQDNIWVGTFSGGLAYLDAKTNKFTYYRNSVHDSNTIGNDKVNALLIDRDNRLWVGTEGGGLNLFNEAQQNFKRINIGNLTPELTVNSLYQCHDGSIWVGTQSDGLFRYRPEEQSIKQYTVDFGLTSNVIQSITEDQDNFLWIGTNNGISKFVFSQNRVTNYSVEEGLQSEQFNPNSVLKCSDGMMVFGGVNGMNAFYPEHIKKSEFIPELIFTNFWLDNIPYGVDEEGSPLSENIIITDEINLKHFQHSFSIEYASLEYDFSRRTRYKTFLEGFEEEWQNRGTERKVTYTNLSPGSYKLRVKSINKDGFMSDQDESIVINIHPAWYQTGIFWALFVVFFVVVVYSIIQWRINFFKHQSSKLENIVALRTNELNEKSNEVLAQNEELSAQNDQIVEQQEELKTARDQLEDLNAELEKTVKVRTKKLEKTVAELDRFVYSASHDLSAPLKSVLGLLNIAKIDIDKSRTKEYLQYMEESILKLEDVIKSLISYSRNSRLELKKEEVNLRELVWTVIHELAFLSTSRTINFTVDIPESEIIITDLQRIKIILHNLINNSIKYADYDKNESTVFVSFRQAKSKNIIEVVDNGIGIEEDQIKKIFSMFYRATEKSTGSGLGLFIVKETIAALGGKIKAESILGKGTSFIITLPQ